MSKLYFFKVLGLKVRRGFMVMAIFLLFPSILLAQNLKFNFPVGKSVSKSELIKSIKGQTNYTFYYRSDVFDDKQNVTVTKNNLSFEEAMRLILGDNFAFSKEGNKIVISKKPQSKATTQTASKIVLKGKVVEQDSKQPIAGATVLLENSSDGAITDENGNFNLAVPIGKKLNISFVGYVDYVYAVKENPKEMIFAMTKSMMEVEDVVVTGLFTRKKESFTGSASTFTGAQLKQIGTQNILESLKVLDPAFNMMANNEFGSDPNKLPDIEIRGKSSIVGMKEVYENDPNQPLFILDGFETTLRTIVDMSVDRVASITVLKDAAASAIYGSKAANGVVVVETKLPLMGKLRVDYNGSLLVTAPDLSDYNLMNAREKLEFERLSGRYDSNVATAREENLIRYNRLKADIDRGVDTYWMAEPLRVGVNQSHNIYAAGGDRGMRYGFGGSYRSTIGIMKNSSRDVFSGNIDLIYRYKGLQFKNQFTIDYTTTEDPIVAYFQYAAANPYYRKLGDDGQIQRYLENFKSSNVAGIQTAQDYNVPNPMWNDSRNSFITGNDISLRNNFMLEWTILESLKASGSFSITKSGAENESFISPEDTRFESTAILEKGSYSNDRNDGTNYSVNASITYGKLFGKKNLVNAVAGFNAASASGKNKSYSAVGFPDGNFTRPSFANSYPRGMAPGYSERISRSNSIFFNGGYSFDNRYLADFNFRLDGSSIFGVNRRYTNTWAFGLAWNIHNEKFLAKTKLFTVLKLRASIGNPGNQNFGGQQTFTTYIFDSWLQNSFGSGLIVSGYGNPDLDWQKTLDKNIGMNASMLGNRLHMTLDVYRKTTDPLLASIGLPSSTGIQRTVTNAGKQINDGVNGTLSYAFIYNPYQRRMLNFTWNFRTENSKYANIGNKLEQFNSKNKKNNSLNRYNDDVSPTALFSVRSMGIDPATGREIFLTKDGTQTYVYEQNNEVVVGNSTPDIEGSCGLSFTYKGFSCSAYLQYSWGGDVFNNALYDKVENISSESLKNNQDKRALYDRWRTPGEYAKFKGISLTDYTQISSRFVEEDNFLSLQSLRVGYTWDSNDLKKWKMNNITVSAYTNDLFRIASIKRERGISYPFARSVSFSLSIGF